MTRPTSPQFAAAVLTTVIPAGAAESKLSASTSLTLRSSDRADSVSPSRFGAATGVLRLVGLRVEAHLERAAMLEKLRAVAATIQATVTLSRPGPALRHEPGYLEFK